MLILGDSEIPHLSHLSYENKLDLLQSLVCKPGISTIFFLFLRIYFILEVVNTELQFHKLARTLILTL